jgi:hypothetical protein
MGSQKGRHYHSWTGPVRAYMRCLATRFFDRGYTTEKELAAIFAHRIPNWKDQFGGTITDKALRERADKARRNASENPETHPEMRLYWEQAGKDMKSGKKWDSWQQLQHELLGESLSEKPPLAEVKQLDPLTELVASRDEEQQYACRSFVVSVRLVAEITRVLKQHGISAIFDPVTS